MPQARCVDPAKAKCGEGLLWDPDRGLLWWVDIAGETLHRFDPQNGATKVIAMPYLISALALSQDGGLLIATAKGLGRVDTETGDIQILHDPEPDQPGNRLNDILAAPDGSLWVGTMSEGAKGPTGALYRYSEVGAEKAMEGRTISNGMAYSPDQKTLYFIDSVPGTLFTYNGSDWRPLRQFDEATGKPDGMTVDQDGTLWIAICDRGCVISMDPDSGAVLQEIPLPCQTVTNCTFGGADLKTLFVTTGTFTMTEDEKTANPLAGGLFAIDLPVAGLLPSRARWPR